MLYFSLHLIAISTDKHCAHNFQKIRFYNLYKWMKHTIYIFEREESEKAELYVQIEKRISEWYRLNRLGTTNRLGKQQHSTHTSGKKHIHRICQTSSKNIKSEKMI